jgi:hypothetical protein
MANLFVRAGTRIRNSLAFRSALAYRLAFSILPLKRQARPLDNRFSYLTLVGEQQLPMLSASLWSLLQSSTKVPHLLVAGDTTLKEPSLRAALKWWPGTIEMWSSEEVLAFSRQNLPPQITSLCENHIYGLKAAAIMRASLSGLTVYADTDILWYRAAQELLPDARTGDGVWLQLQVDGQMSYDPRLVELWPFLREKPYSCAGIMVAQGDLGDAFTRIASPDLDPIYGSPRHFTEQATFAALQKKIGLPPLDEDKAYLSMDDQQTLGPSFHGKPWVLRHYAGSVRHLFWRDVFFLYWKGTGARA